MSSWIYTILVNQSAFVDGQKMLDISLVENKFLEHIHKINEKGLVLKLDFEKTYDNVELL